MRYLQWMVSWSWNCHNVRIMSPIPKDICSQFKTFYVANFWIYWLIYYTFCANLIISWGDIKENKSGCFLLEHPQSCYYYYQSRQLAVCRLVLCAVCCCSCCCVSWLVRRCYCRQTAAADLEFEFERCIQFLSSMIKKVTSRGTFPHCKFYLECMTYLTYALSLTNYLSPFLCCTASVFLQLCLKAEAFYFFTFLLPLFLLFSRFI